MPTRCFGDGDPVYEAYHDHEWGRPVTDERHLFELVCLEGFQAGLSWRTILLRREGFRAAFADFEPERVAAFTAADVERLLGDPGIIRHRGKIEAVIANACATLALRQTATPLPQLIWSFRPEPGPAPRALSDIPTATAESRALAKALRAKGFRFFGETTAYAMMQAAGLVNDHLATCPVRAEIAAAAR
jgi:DNA-3-methyladenine glycosylase I